MDPLELMGTKDKFVIKVSDKIKKILYVAILIGLATFFIGHLFGENTRAWGGFLFNLMFFFGLSLIGVAFGNMQDIVGAQWARPVKRLHEMFGYFIPISTFLFLVFFICLKFNLLKASYLYPWIVDTHLLDHFYGKRDWLKIDFMLIRDSLALLIILLLSYWHLKLTSRRDEIAITQDYKKGVSYGEKINQKFRYWSAPILFIYAVLYSLIFFDLTMSLAPTWFSTLWAGWGFSIMMQTMFAFMLIIMFKLKDKEFGKFIKRQQFHDIGKLLFGFTVFYAYLTFAHILTYWFGNVPEETSYFITRLEKPWFYYVIAAPFFTFLIPFVMMIPRNNKWTKGIAVPVSVIVILSQWVNFMLVVMPDVVDKVTFGFPWMEIGIFIGFFGLFVLIYLKSLEKHPAIGIADPLLISYYKDSH